MPTDRRRWYSGTVLSGRRMVSHIDLVNLLNPVATVPFRSIESQVCLVKESLQLSISMTDG